MTKVRGIGALIAMLAVASCGGGGGGGSSAPPAPTPVAIGSVSPASVTFSNQIINTASSAQTVTLSNTGNATLSSIAISIGGANSSSFTQTNTCSATLAAGSNCTISVVFNPQTAGALTASINITANVAVPTVALSGTGIPTFTIGGTVTGLNGGNTVVLANGSDSVSVAANGAFTFKTAVVQGNGYAVSITTQPTGQTCTLSNPTGSNVTANVTNVNVSCATNTYTVGGTLSGASAIFPVVLTNNGGDNLTLNAAGSFNFATPVPYGQAYSVAIASSSPGETCTVSNGSGTVTATVSNVAISCAVNSYAIGGLVSGLASGQTVVLTNSGGDSLNVNGNGSFTFKTPVTFGGSYAVTVATQPTGQTCTVTSGAGTVANTVSNIGVICVTNTYTVGGSISGLLSGQSVILKDNSGDPLSVTSNGNFTFSTKVAYNASYSVTVGTQPGSETCSVSAGTGTVGSSNVTSVVVSCVANTYTIGVTVNGLGSGGSLTLKNNGADALPISSNGSYTFATSIAYNQSYNVTIATQPTGQNCTVANPSGTASGNVNNVTVTCVTLKVGKFIDAAVGGLTYDCGNGVTGTTDMQGQFNYPPGASCKFSVGNVTVGQLPTIPPDGTVTPYDAAGVARPSSSNNTASSPAAVAIAQFLQSVSATDPTTGAAIIAPAVSTQLSSIPPVVIASPTTGVVSQSDLATVVASASPTATLVPPTQAQAAVQTGLAQAAVDPNAGAVSPTAPAILVGLQLSAASAVIGSGSTDQITATALYSDGSAKDVTGSVSWSSSDATIGTVNGAGLLSTSGYGVVTISASNGTQTGSAKITVAPSTVTQLVISAISSTVDAGKSVVLTAIATFSNGVQQVVSGLVTWVTTSSGGASSSATVTSYTTLNTATMTDSAAETVSVTASYGGVTSNAIPVTFVNYSVGGTVTGLNSGNVITLALNGATTTVNSNSFTFLARLNSGTAYVVTVATQPTGQTCTVSNGQGSGITANVTNVAVACTTNTYTVSGTVTGLASGQSVVLNNNGGDALTVSATGAFTFATKVAYGTAYVVTVATQPTGQTCTVSNGQGSGITANVTNVAVACTTNTYTVGVTVSGLTPGNTLLLMLNGIENLSVTSNGVFQFTSKISFNQAYTVTLPAQPAGQQCTLSNSSGFATTNVNNVSINCIYPFGLNPSVDITNSNNLLLAPIGLGDASTIHQMVRRPVVHAAVSSTNNDIYSVDKNGSINTINLANFIAGSKSPANTYWMSDSIGFTLIGYNGLFTAPAADGTSKQCVIVGVRKSDGMVACLSRNPRCVPASNCDVTHYGSQIRTDETGNFMYVVGGEGGFYLENLTDPKNPVETVLFTHDQTGDASFPVVNAKGDAITTINVMSGPTVIYKLFSQTIGATQLSENNIQYAFSGAGVNKNNFYYASDDNPNSQVSMIKLSPNSDGSYTKTVLTTVSDSDSVSKAIHLNSTGFQSAVPNGNIVYAIGYNPENSSKTTDGNYLYAFHDNPFSVDQIALTSDFYYESEILSYSGGIAILGVDKAGVSNGIQRFNVGSKTVSTVLPIGQYNISSITVNSVGKITFAGIRLSDNANVIGTINADDNTLSVKTVNNAVYLVVPAHGVSLVSLTISSIGNAISVGQSIVINALATFADGLQQVVTSLVNWVSQITTNSSAVTPTSATFSIDGTTNAGSVTDAVSEAISVAAQYLGLTSNSINLNFNGLSISGSVSGLVPNSSLSLQLNGGSSLTVAGNGNFAFAQTLNVGQAFVVTVSAQSAGQTCSIANGSGTTGTSAITNVLVTCIPQSFAIGGTITGLASDQTIVISNNSSDTLSISSNGSFTFNTAVNYGSNYSVSIQSQPNGQLCAVSNQSGVVNAAVSNVQIACTNAFGSFMAGASVGGVRGSYLSGSLAPGAREFASAQASSSGIIYVFGGFGVDGLGATGYLNDLWFYNSSGNKWSYLGGSQVISSAGSYGSLGVADPSNSPPARYSAASWVDSQGNFYIFGGFVTSPLGSSVTNDLWVYSPTSKQWTWLSGSSGFNAVGTYIVHATSGNQPSARSGAVTWIDGSGNMWLFGGFGVDSAGVPGSLNDLWKYNPISRQWTWVSGSANANVAGTYGSLGVQSINSSPGARGNAVGWYVAPNKLWLMGGAGIDAQNSNGLLNDLWVFDTQTSMWTWESGSSAVNASGSYGSNSVNSSVPGARSGAASFVGSDGSLWLFGGDGFDSTGTAGTLGDLWKYSPAAGWKWVLGPKLANGIGVYTPTSAQTPGSRAGAAYWSITTNTSGNSFWVLGGYQSNGTNSTYMNDLWKLQP